MATRRSVETPTTTETRTRSASAKGARGKSAAVPASVSAEERRAMIAEAAYLRAERRGFTPGHETEDWLAAETEVDALLALAQGGAAQ